MGGGRRLFVCEFQYWAGLHSVMGHIQLLRFFRLTET
jgi:hypothetical protein